MRYKAVAGAAVRAEMHAFLEWFNAHPALDGLLRAGLTHLWFESIHPFEDGNGRVDRAVVDLALAQDLRRSSRLLGLGGDAPPPGRLLRRAERRTARRWRRDGLARVVPRHLQRRLPQK